MPPAPTFTLTPEPVTKLPSKAKLPITLVATGTGLLLIAMILFAVSAVLPVGGIPTLFLVLALVALVGGIIAAVVNLDSMFNVDTTAEADYARFHNWFKQHYPGYLSDDQLHELFLTDAVVIRNMNGGAIKFTLEYLHDSNSYFVFKQVNAASEADTEDVAPEPIMFTPIPLPTPEPMEEPVMVVVDAPGCSVDGSCDVESAPEEETILECSLPPQVLEVLQATETAPESPSDEPEPVEAPLTVADAPEAPETLLEPLTTVQADSMTVKELRHAARDRKIPNWYNMRRIELVTLLTE